MKKFILLLMFGVCGMIAQAATKYEINVAGVEVTSDNCNNIAPASNNDIESGYAVYSPSTNTLTCYNLRISRLSSGDYGIHNRKCDDLTIVFKNTCYVFSKKAPALKLERSTTIKVEDQTQLSLQAGDITGSDGSTNTIELGSYDYFFMGGNGNISIRNFSPQAKDCFKGNGNNNSCVVFSGGVVTVKSDKGYAFNSTKAYFRSGSDVRIQPNGTKQSFYSSAVSAYEGAAILEPFGAYSDLGNTVYTSSGTAITNQDIYISSKYVAIFKENWIPDANFRQALLNIIPKGYITSSDVPNITSLDVSYKNISDIVGIQWFSDLKSLNCSHNNITSFNISMLSKLQTFNCSYNQVSTIYGSFPSSLTNLNLYSNNLTSIPTLPSGLQYLNLGVNKFVNLDIRGHNSLKEFTCIDNKSLKEFTCASCSQLTYLSVSGCSAMTSLSCYNNRLSSSMSVNGCSGLVYFDCINNNIPSLDVSGCTKLQTLYCANNSITTITGLSECSSLIELGCNSNRLTSLVITGNRNFAYLNCKDNPTLKTLKCYDNALVLLSTSNCPELTTIDCSGNKLNSLDVSSLNKLTTLHAHNNTLKTVNVANCSALKELWVCYNGLTALSLSGCSALRELWIQKNQIKGNGMTSLINSLRTIPTSESEGLLGVFEPSYSIAEGNELTNAQNIAARAKRWIPKKYSSGWNEIPVKGDVNGDGKINVSDVTALVNMILGVIPKNEAVADINGDGKVNVSDVTALINIILGVS